MKTKPKQAARVKAKISPATNTKIVPFLWFDQQAGEAARFYTSLFKNSKIIDERLFPEGSPAPKGTVMTATFVLEGLKITALNGGPYYKLTPAVSFFVNCETQAEVDHLWDSLLEGGKAMRCGWLTDKFGVSWQIVPTILGDLLQDEDDEKAGRVMQAMLQMVKLDIQKLKDASAGKITPKKAKRK